jgi:hypothetical protein
MLYLDASVLQACIQTGSRSRWVLVGDKRLRTMHRRIGPADDAKVTKRTQVQVLTTATEMTGGEANERSAASAPTVDAEMTDRTQIQALAAVKAMTSGWSNDRSGGSAPTVDAKLRNEPRLRSWRL